MRPTWAEIDLDDVGGSDCPGGSCATFTGEFYGQTSSVAPTDYVNNSDTGDGEVIINFQFQQLN